jgi:broad specificity phosphatase PhoE
MTLVRVAALAAVALIASAQSTIFISRHADRLGTEPDPALTAVGEKQAEALAHLLQNANIRHIYTTELLRTRQTAAPTAKSSSVKPVIVAQDRFDDLIARIRETATPAGATLVVGHRQTVPRIVKALTGKEITPLGSGEYGRLIVVTLFPDGASSILTLRY